jgi:hydrophobe/amphiphile efflux-1 (HAE1) family protein
VKRFDPSGRRGLVHWAITHPVGTTIISVSVCVLGLSMIGRLAVDLLPRIIYPQIMAIVTNPEVDPEVMEQTVAKVLEPRLATTEDAVLVASSSGEGRTSVELHFAYGTDVDLALRDASTKLDQARGALPEEAEPPVIFKFDPSQIPVLQFAVSSTSRDQAWLKRWCEDQLAKQLLTVTGVASVDVVGGLDREIQVILDPERLRSYGLTVSEVLDRLREENQDISAGRLRSPGRELLSKTKGKFRTVDDIRRVRLPLAGGGDIAVADVATVIDTYSDDRIYTRMDRDPAVQVAITKQPDSNTVRVVDSCLAVLERLRRDRFFPPGIESRMIQDQAFYVRAAVNGVATAALVGGGLAMVVVFLFLRSVRRTLVIGTSIPIAILGCVALMGGADLTLNIMSLGGLALGIGMLVDNSIVMLENIDRHQRQQPDPVEAAHEGAGEVASAVTASTLTNLAAVVPFFLMGGLTALLFNELLATISFAILTSLLVALTLTPMLAAQLARIRVRSRTQGLRLLGLLPRAVGSLEGWYRRRLPWVLSHRWLVLVAAFGALAASLVVAGRLGSEFLPPVDDGRVRMYIRMPPETPLEATDRASQIAEQVVLGLPKVVHVFTTSGGRIWGRGAASMPTRFSMEVELEARSRRGMSATSWIEMAAAALERISELTNAEISIRPPRIRGLRTSTGTEDIEVKVFGDNLDTLQRIGLELADRLQSTPGLSAVESSYQEISPEVRVEIDRRRAADLGLDVGEVGRTVRTAVGGSVPTRLTEGDREFDIRVRFAREAVQTEADLAAVPLFPRSGAPLRLRDVADVHEGVAPQSIEREQQNRVVHITASVLPEYWSVGEATTAIRDILADYPLPDGYRMLFGGQEEAIRENQRILLGAIALAIFMVFSVMAVQYESFVNPLVIMMAIPLAVVGVVAALLITGLPTSAPVMLGMILLAGIVVNNGILLVEYIEIRRRGGDVPRLDAVLEAAPLRVRPILMTMTTTVIGMLPLALNPSEGAELMAPLAVAVIGGLVVSTALTLFVVPALYLTLTGAAEALARRLVVGAGAPSHPA